MRRLLVLALILPLLSAPLPVADTAQEQTAFGRLVVGLSEPGGFFASDNLVSNETSYLHVLDGFRGIGVRGGAYVGVGPEQGFSYIAEIEPEIAYIVDIRRDNMLLHLLVKAIFERSRNRMEYLSLLYGRPAPAELALWTDLPLFSLLDHLDRAFVDSMAYAKTHRELLKHVIGYGVPISAEDRNVLDRFHWEFASSGLDIQYTTRNRWSRRAFPTNRQLYQETDLSGAQASYLSSEDRWRVVRDLERRNLVIPVVGDLSGPVAVRAVARHLRETNRKVSVMYLSNVESYLFRQGGFERFVENVRTLPADSNSVMVRSWFGRGWSLPGSVPGHFSTQLLQTFSRFLQLTAQPDSVDYWTLVNDAVDLQSFLPADAGRNGRP